MVLDYILTHYYNQTFLILYILNFLLIIIAYKLGFAKKLPLLKNVIIYFLLAIGTFLLVFFIVFAELPITESLIIIVLVLAIYRSRLAIERSKRKKEIVDE